MSQLTRSVAGAFDRAEWRRLGGCYAVVLMLHILGWGILLGYGAGNPAFLGLGVLAYTFGLRHAFDADHIAAIDNVTRKLQQQGRRSVGQGLSFSLGHSTVVFVVALLLAFAVRGVLASVIGSRGVLHGVGGIVGTSVSGGFLLAIGLLNLLVLLDLLRAMRRLRAGEGTAGVEALAGGLYTRLFGRLFRLVDRSWHLYPIGVLFGLGFDTATEVALLGISAGVAAKGLPVLAVVSLPLLFAAGMSLMDTTDGAFMTQAYGWAFSNPIRKIFYNLTVTSLSVFVALFVGLVEVAQLVARTAGLRGGVWAALGGLDFERLGLVIVGAFLLAWVAAVTIFKLARIEQRWSTLP